MNLISGGWGEVLTVLQEVCRRVWGPLLNTKHYSVHQTSVGGHTELGVSGQVL